MFCTNCGKKLDDGARFCSECGFAVSEPTSTNFDPNVREMSESQNLIVPEEHDFSEQKSETVNFRPERANIRKPIQPYLLKTIIVSNDSRKSASSSIVRGAIGGVLLGPVGLLGGAISGKNKKDTTFLLIYSNGVKKTVTVKTNGMLFKQYVKYLEY